MAIEWKEKQKKLKKVRVRNIVLNLVCVCLAVSGLWWTANYFWRYVNYEVTNDAFVDQYVAPLNVRASGYIKEVRFKEHQYVHQGDTLLVLDNREYQIKVKEAEAALLDAHGSQDVLHSGIETSHTNIAVQDANIAEAKAKLWQLEQDYHRFERLLKEESVPEQQYEQAKAAYEAAKAVGEFHRRLRDFDSSQLGATVPKLHDMRNAMRQLLDAVRADICFRTSDCQEQIQFVLDRSKQLNQIQDAMESKQIPRRVTHNDTRYSNVLIDSDSKKSICLIDLDTVMSGASILDFGDAVRAGAATFTEDEKFGNIELDLDLYRGYVQGYCHEMGRILTAKEKELMVYAVWLMAMESGIRFLTDYLSGDRNITNFSDERQNLYRAVNQFFLVLDIEEKKEQMNEITAAVLMKK